MTIAQRPEQKGLEKGSAEGFQFGEQCGIEKGRNEGKLEVARTMLQNGIDRNTVIKMTGLTEEDLVQLRHKKQLTFTSFRHSPGTQAVPDPGSGV